MENKLSEEYLKLILDKDGDEKGRRTAWNHMQNGIAHYAVKIAPINYIPSIFDSETEAYFKELAHTAYGIFGKIIREYLKNPEFRKIFHFDKRVEELILMDTGCPEIIPVMRMDAVFNEETKDFHFLECNTDASGGMADSFESFRAIKDTEVFKEFSKRHKVTNRAEKLFEHLTQNFKDIYESTGKAVEKPHVAIAVLFDSPDVSVSQLEFYIHYFENLGMKCSVFDVRELKLENGRLFGHHALAGESEVEINVVWRFCVMTDLMIHWDEVQSFLDALRSKKAIMIGSFATQVVHDKQIMMLLRNEKIQSLLDDKEKEFVNEHIPFTCYLEDPALDLENVREHPENWIIKPSDWYGGINVYAGKGLSKEEWKERIELCLKENVGSAWLVQEYINPYKTKAIPLTGKNEEFTAEICEAGNIPSLYIYRGEFQDVYMRQGMDSVICDGHGVIAAPVVWAEQ